jgi:hypothetical protein
MLTNGHGQAGGTIQPKTPRVRLAPGLVIPHTQAHEVTQAPPPLPRLVIPHTPHRKVREVQRLPPPPAKSCLKALGPPKAGNKPAKRLAFAVNDFQRDMTPVEGENGSEADFAQIRRRHDPASNYRRIPGTFDRAVRSNTTSVEEKPREADESEDDSYDEGEDDWGRRGDREGDRRGRDTGESGRKGRDNRRHDDGEDFGVSNLSLQGSGPRRDRSAGSYVDRGPRRGGEEYHERRRGHRDEDREGRHGRRREEDFEDRGRGEGGRPRDGREDVSRDRSEVRHSRPRDGEERRSRRDPRYYDR